MKDSLLTSVNDSAFVDDSSGDAAEFPSKEDAGRPLSAPEQLNQPMNSDQAPDASTSFSSLNATHEAIVREVHALYVAADSGLVAIAARAGVQLLPPRRKATVLLVGNHSAGKSSFINWYIQDNIQRTGVAMETNHVTLVSSGKRREQLGGDASVEAFPFLHGLANEADMKNCITTEISSSRARRFPMVTFVDTPGLVDGEMAYAFDIERALLWMGARADLILVFFDPMGQALSKRSLDVVEALQLQCGATNTNKIAFCLSKADTAGPARDRQKVILQIVQNLCRRAAFNKVALELPTIFIPQQPPQDGSSLPRPSVSCDNQLDEVCAKIDQTINLAVQHTLTKLRSDATTVIAALDENMATAAALRRVQRKRIFGGAGITVFALAMLGTALLALSSHAFGGHSSLEGALKSEPTFSEIISAHFAPSATDQPLRTVHPLAPELFMRLALSCHWLMRAVLGAVSMASGGHASATFVFVFLASSLLLLGRRLMQLNQPLVTKGAIARLANDKTVVTAMLATTYRSLYDSYLAEAVGSDPTL